MTWFARRRAPKPGLLRTADRADLEHLRSFAASRSGVEGYWEPRTAVTEATLVLVAADGEWTRRRIGGQHEAEQFARSLAMPLYEAARVGYPQRMRDATTRRAKAARDANAAGGGPADS